MRKSQNKDEKFTFVKNKHNYKDSKSAKRIKVYYLQPQEWLGTFFKFVLKVPDEIFAHYSSTHFYYTFKWGLGSASKSDTFY
jgi:hypothetical protein